MLSNTALPLHMTRLEEEGVFSEEHLNLHFEGILRNKHGLFNGKKFISMNQPYGNTDD
jgi:hypothetical protein